jgi:hypothetical protein
MQTDNARHGTLGALWAIYGLICIVKAAWIVVYWGTLTVMWGALLNRVANPLFWMNAFHTWLFGAVILLILAALFCFGAAMALLRRDRSSRVLPVVAGLLAIITGPLGTALGVFTLIIVLTQPSSQTRSSLASAA